MIDLSLGCQLNTVVGLKVIKYLLHSI